MDLPSSSGGKGKDSGSRKNDVRKSGRADEGEKSKGGLWGWATRLSAQQGSESNMLPPPNHAPSVIIEEIADDIWVPVERGQQLAAI